MSNTILLIDNYDSFTWNLYQQIASLSGQKVEVIRNDAITLEEIRAKDPSHIVLSPGPGGPEDAGICLEIVKRLTGIYPILGVCLGHQVIAKAFGASVVPSGRPVHGKTSPIYHTGQGIFSKLPSPTVVGRYHSLIIEEQTLPLAVSVTARCSEGRVMALAHASAPLFGVQFHPESFLTVDGDQLIQNFLCCMPAPLTVTSSMITKQAPCAVW